MQNIIKQRGRLIRSSQRIVDQWQRTGWGHSVVCVMNVLEVEEYHKRQRQLRELRVTMIHVRAVGNDVILCPIDLFSVATGKSCCYQSVDMTL